MKDYRLSEIKKICERFNHCCQFCSIFNTVCAPCPIHYDIDEQDIIELPYKEHSKVNGEYADWIVYFRLEEHGEIYSKFFDEEQKADEFLEKMKGENHE